MPIYSLQHQFLTDTANIQTFQCGDVKGASEQYLFAMNNEMIRTVANTNFFAVPTSDDDSKKRTAVNLPLRFNRNSTTKKYDAYASQQPFVRFGQEFDGAEDNSSFVHKLCTYRLFEDWVERKRPSNGLWVVGFFRSSCISCRSGGRSVGSKKMREMYREPEISSPLDFFCLVIFLLQYLVFANTLTVGLSRLIKKAISNSNYMCSFFSRLSFFAVDFPS